MYIPPQFEESRVEVLHQLIRSYSLGTLVTLSASGMEANHIPFHLTPEPTPFGTLQGHMARANPAWKSFYGFTRDELRYILDPADVMGEDYPSETFRVLKKNEEREFGEYRTQRLVLEAWDKLETGELH